MITRIKAKNYRCFSDLDLELGNYHILAGANGSGKTTLLDIPAVFADLLYARTVGAAFLETGPGQMTPRARHPRELIHQLRGNAFSLGTEVRLPESVTQTLAGSTSEEIQRQSEKCLSALRYEVGFEISHGTEIHLITEELCIFSEKFREHSGVRVIQRNPGTPSHIFPECPSDQKKLTFQISPRGLALASVPDDNTQFPAVTWFRNFLRDQNCPYRPDWRKLRLASAPGASETLTPDGTNLPWLVRDLQKKDHQGFTEWIEHVRIALPNIARIEAVERKDDHHAYFRVICRNGLEVTSSGLSDGTLRILSLTVLPYLTLPPKLVTIEEPENGIHPQAIEAVLQSLSALYDSQVWISTHSPVVLANTKLSEILCMRLGEDDSAQVVPGDRHPRLRDWQGQIDIGTLFSAGVLE